MAAKSGPKSGTFQRGKDPRRGTGPPKGQGGRPSSEFITQCSGIFDEAVLPQIKAYVTSHSPDDTGYRWAVDHLLAYGKGKPVQPVGPALTDDDVIPFAVRIVE